MTQPDQPKQVEDDPIEEETVDSEEDEEAKVEDTDSDEEMDILEIIEENSQADGVPDTETDHNHEDSLPRPSAHEFSFSSLGTALGGALQASTTTLGSATASLHSKGMEKLRESFSQMQVPSARELVAANEHSTRGIPSSRRRFVTTPKKSTRKPVDFGEFEYRASRLQYSKEDIWNIANDPAQMQELRLALRSLGAVTDGVLKQKLHWYVKNSKRARREAEERAEQEKLRQQQQQKLTEERMRRQQFEEPSTPPTEHKVIDGCKVLEDVAGVVNPDDPSPKSVRGIFVPRS